MMKREEFLTTVLNNKLEYLIVTSRNKEKDGEMLSKLELHFKTIGNAKSGFDEKTKRFLLDAFASSYPEFIDKLMVAHIGSEPITTSIKTTTLNLPRTFQRTHDFCHTFRAGDLEIHFLDSAMDFFKRTITSLDERSKVDVLTFAKAKLMKGKTNHMLISFDTTPYTEPGRVVYFDREKSVLPRAPKNSLYYYADTDSEKGADPKDIANILTLIDVFAKMYGMFDDVKYNNNTFMATSHGHSLSIEGDIETIEAKAKVMSLLKR